MQRILRQGTAFTFQIGQMIASADGSTAVTDLTLAQADVRVSKNGGAYANINQASSATHAENGFYFKAGSVTDSDTPGDLHVVVVKAGTLGFDAHFAVWSQSAWDALFAGTTPLPVNATQISGDTVAADNAESFFDGTGYAGTNNVIPTVTIVNGLAANSLTAAAAAADLGTELGAAAATAVWAAGARTLTAGTNISLAKGTGVTGFNDLDAAGIRAATGLASANLDTQLADLPTNAELATALVPIATAANLAIVDTVVDAIKVKTDAITLTVTGKVDANITHVIGSAIQADGSGTTNWGAAA